MDVSKRITNIELDKEFRVCPTCGYEMGFHISFQNTGQKNEYKIILICPNCGARFDIGWSLSR